MNRYMYWTSLDSKCPISLKFWGWRVNVVGSCWPVPSSINRSSHRFPPILETAQFSNFPTQQVFLLRHRTLKMDKSELNKLARNINRMMSMFLDTDGKCVLCNLLAYFLLSASRSANQYPSSVVMGLSPINTEIQIIIVLNSVWSIVGTVRNSSTGLCI